MKTVKEVQLHQEFLERVLDRVGKALVTAHKINSGVGVSPYIFGTEFRHGDLRPEVLQAITDILDAERQRLYAERNETLKFLETLDSLVAGFEIK
ncbi:hypothetical protein PR1_89 [Providencia phage vB_PreS_PR1]|uniref:Uncharacterized protein n=2 Tax=Priunavirus TaxID=2560210 RepID=A0A873WHV6_9CAUD|nr:hypothetical protein FDH30_gp126 [Providencia phage vB_PreS_PR1]YP_010114019.1 hypothetical protein KNV68_gp126 [Providencia phage PSTCR5]AQT25325.1 hypothetical protein PR1_89 [Providencia phage vB_PreS_PR1]QPB12232.1 hypothetical protein [Providencia phage PSTCR5]